MRVADVGPDAIVFEVGRRAGAARRVRGAPAPARDQGARPHGPDRPRPRVRSGAPPAGNSSTPNERTRSWRPSTATATSSCSTARWPCSATAARGTRTRSNLHESGVDVVVGLREGSASRDAAEEAGLTVATVAEAVAGAQLVVLLLPDQVQPSVYEQDVAPNLAEGAALVFAHGFNVHYGRIPAPAGPRRAHGRAEGPGPRRPPALHRGPRRAGRRRGRAGRERPGARARARLRRPAIGAGRAGMIETTFAEETETDLFGEQAVLCGGVDRADPRRASRRSSRPATSPRSPTTSACTS